MCCGRLLWWWRWVVGGGVNNSDCRTDGFLTKSGQVFFNNYIIKHMDLNLVKVFPTTIYFSSARNIDINHHPWTKNPWDPNSKTSMLPPGEGVAVAWYYLFGPASVQLRSQQHWIMDGSDGPSHRSYLRGGWDSSPEKSYEHVYTPFYIWKKMLTSYLQNSKKSKCGNAWVIMLPISHVVIVMANRDEMVVSSIIHCIISLHGKQPQKKKHWLNWNWQTFKTQKHTTTFSYFSYTSPPSMIAGISSNTWLALSICSSYLPDFSCCIDLVQLVQQCSFMKYSKHETYSISRGCLDIYIYMWLKKTSYTVNDSNIKCTSCLT